MKPSTSIFIIDSTVMKSMIEGKNDNKAVEVLQRLNELKKMKVPCGAMTTLSSLLHAIWISDDNAKISNLKKMLETITIVALGNDHLDYKDEKKVIENIIKLAAIISPRKKSEEKGDK
jgi:hypothetical protein